jgi:hypothetical protein
MKTNGKSYKCATCQKSFSQKGDMLQINLPTLTIDLTFSSWPPARERFKYGNIFDRIFTINYRLRSNLGIATENEVILTFLGR